MEYRIAKGWRIFVIIFCVVFLIVGIAFLVHSFTEPRAGSKILFVIFGLVFIPISILMYLDAVKTRLVIDEYSLTMVRAFTSRTLLLNDIAGYRKGDKNMLYLIPKSENGKRLLLSNYYYWGDKAAFMGWLTEKLPDVDVVQLEEETRNLLGNDQFGLTREDREDNLKKARQVAKGVNIAATGLALWSFAYPRPYQYVAILLLAAPWVGIALTWYFKGLMRFDTKKSSPYPSVTALIFVSAGCLLLRAMLDFDLYDHKMIWLPVISLAGILSFLCFMVCRKALTEGQNKMTAPVFMFIVSFIYTYGALVMTNCYHDRSVSQVFRVEIKDKSIHTGKTTTYYLRLAPWGRFPEEEDVSVPKRLYEATQTGDKVYVYLKKGTWNIPWYWVTN
ncbi:MAG TPA: hypothetical protein VL832_22735 [Puia sp.]|jgi:hypothetical protein|nr:hypothetical protein [Puia sp.]